MKDALWLYYHIQIEEMQEYEEYSSFVFHEKNYYFTKMKRTQEEFNDLLQVCKELMERNIPVFSFIQNVEGSFLTRIENNSYVLVEVSDETYEYSILEMLKRIDYVRLKPKKNVLYRNEWAKLWSEKVDYLEYQVRELGKSYPVIINSFSYFVGLAENAIAYVQSLQKLGNYPLSLVLSHRRVAYPNYRLNYDNPLNFIFDVEVRDFAEYLKSMALVHPDYALIDLKTYMNIKKPDLYQSSLLYARLLYPSYYFDLHEKIINQNMDEQLLIPILEQVSTYENFLKNAWHLIHSFAPIEPVAWLL